MQMPTTTSGHAMSPPTMPWASEAIRPACGAESCAVAEADAALVDVALVQQQQREVQRQARHGDADEVADLHASRRAAQDVPDLQVLQHLARDRRGDADHRRHAQHRGHARHAARLRWRPSAAPR